VLAHHADQLDRLAEHLDSVDVWTRATAPTRQPRLTRDDITACAIRIADAEGLDALSMRRIATDLDVGTMSLYHYVRTKDELLTLVVDAFMAEIVVPAGTRMPKDWRGAVMIIAKRTKAAIERHPWVLDITDDPPIGPNVMRHFDQTHQAVASFDGTIGDRIDLMLAVDEYVFGHCLHARNVLTDDDATGAQVMDYMSSLIDRGELPSLAAAFHQHGAAPFWKLIHHHMSDPKRFERNLHRLLDGFEARVKR
jgi:AcrR family transcriptional regulator